MEESERQEKGLALQLLLKIRSESCDGVIKINMSNINNILINILKRMDLIKCKTFEKELSYYVGVNEKGRKLCKQFGVN